MFWNSGMQNISSVKWHFETNHKSFCEKSEPEQKEFIANAIKDRNKQSTSMFKYVCKNCHTSAASYSAANAIARHGKPFQEGEFLKEAWLACAPSLFDDFDNKDKISQRIKDFPLSRNTMKDRILKLAENVTDQQKNDINSVPFVSLWLDESIDITKSARLAVFARYCVGNIIKEELIAITSLLTTTKGTDICTAVRNSLAEKEIDLKKIASVTSDGAPNMTLLVIQSCDGSTPILSTNNPLGEYWVFKNYSIRNPFSRRKRYGQAFVAYPHRPMILHSPTENSLAVLNHKILEANSQVQNVKLGGHQTCLSINRLWHELCDMLRRLVGTTAPGHHDCSIQE
ncbi:general transcription factor II-I repeat domain-containing protein 2A [Trichonephila clavipes]|nr:general transcription factor II-I repeat domain-containing protein 2A [Trichonephila clavipes]